MRLHLQGNAGVTLRLLPGRESPFRTGEEEPGRLHRRGRVRKTEPEGKSL